MLLAMRCEGARPRLASLQCETEPRHAVLVCASCCLQGSYPLSTEEELEEFYTVTKDHSRRAMYRGAVGFIRQRAGINIVMRELLV